jgi:hypothetical protein
MDFASSLVRHWQRPEHDDGPLGTGSHLAVSGSFGLPAPHAALVELHGSWLVRRWQRFGTRRSSTGFRGDDGRARVLLHDGAGYWLPGALAAVDVWCPADASTLEDQG